MRLATLRLSCSTASLTLNPQNAETAFTGKISYEPQLNIQNPSYEQYKTNYSKLSYTNNPHNVNKHTKRKHKMLHKKLKELHSNQRATSIITIIVIAAIIVAAVLCAVLIMGRFLPSRTIVGSRNVITKDMDFSDFTTVEVGGGFNVEITRSSLYSVHITADNNTFDYIDVSKTGDTLNIRLRIGYSYKNVTLKADIKMPNLYAVTLSGGTRGNAKEFTSTQDFNLELSGGSTFELEGSANNLNFDASGGSRADLSDFSVYNATVSLSGGSQATINLSGTLDASLSGGSQLQYIGTPTMGNINTSGGSTITKKQ